MPDASDHTPHFELVRTKRKKTIGVQVVGGTVRVSAPHHVPTRQVQDLVYSRRAWIAREIQRQAQLPPPMVRTYTSGETFGYLGKAYALAVQRTDDALPTAVHLTATQVQVTVSADLPDADVPAQVRYQLGAWYRLRAHHTFADKTKKMAKQIGVQPRSVQVRDYKARWGSCTAHGDIYYNWRLVMAPDCIADYVVVHELCHLLEHNHSPRYWQHVEHAMPEYREHRDWLKSHGDTLLL